MTRFRRTIIAKPGLFLLFALIAAAGIGSGCETRRSDSNPVSSDWRSFEGTWNASGTRQTLHLGEKHSSIVRIGGSLILTNANVATLGFRADAIAYSDDAHGMIGSAVWTDEQGDQVFSELKGQRVGTGNRVSGTVIGGTGRYANVIGDYEFEWQYVIAAEEGSVQGRAVGFKGRVRRNDAGAAPQPAEGKQP